MLVLPSVRQSIDALAFSPNGQWIAVGGSSYKAGFQIWNIDAQSPLLTKNPIESAVYRLQWIEGLELSLLAGSRGSGAFVVRYTGKSFEIQRRYDNYFCEAVDLRTLWYTDRPSRASSHLLEATLKDDGTLQPIWRSQLAGGWGIAVRTIGSTRIVSAEYQFQDGGYRGTTCVVIRSRADGKILHRLHYPHKSLDSMAVSRDGTAVCFANRNTIQIWSDNGGFKKTTELKNIGRRYFTAIAFHPSGCFLAAANNDNTIQYFDTSNWKQTHSFIWDIGRMRSLAFSPNGCLAAAGSDNGNVVIWDVEA